MEMTTGDGLGSRDEMDETAELGTALGVVGPRLLAGAPGSKVRARWALGSGSVEEGVRVEWLSDGRILAHEETVATIEFDLDGARSGDLLRRSVRAVLRGPDWSLELPALPIEILVGS